MSLGMGWTGKEPAVVLCNSDCAEENFGKNGRRVLIALVAALASVGGRAQAGEVSGVVKFDGPPPKLAAIDTKVDPYCQQMYAEKQLFPDEATIAPDGAFANIFVYVTNPPAGAYPPPAEPVELDQFGCRYSMPVFGIMVGQTLSIKNSDKTTHNVRGFPTLNRPFNFGQPPALPPRTRVFDKAEMPMKIKCDVHGWMKAFCFVMDHPFFAVSGPDGHFTIKNLPVGKYTVKAWHERLGELQQEITITDTAPAKADFTFRRLERKS